MKFLDIGVRCVWFVLFFIIAHYYQQLTGAFVTLKRQWWIKTAVYTGLAFIVNTIIISQDILNITGSFSALLLILLAGYEGSLFHKLSAAFTLYPFVAELNYLTNIFLRFLPPINTTDYTIAVLILKSISCLITLLFWFLMHRIFSGRLRYAKEYLTSRLLFLLDVISLAPLLSMTYIVVTASWKLFPLTLPVIAINIITSIGILLLVVHMAESTRMKAEMENLRLQQTYYQELEHNQQEIRRLRHDMNNQLSAISMCLEQGCIEEAKEYFAAFSGTVSVTNRVFCKNNLLNAILNSKYNLAGEKEIDAFFHIELPENIFPDNTELCSLFANLLDNAIEACVQVTEPSSRILELKVRCDKGFFILQIINTYGNELKFAKGVYQTTKKEKQMHGFGLARVTSLVKKRNGTLDIHHDEEKFYVMIIIPVKSKTPLQATEYQLAALQSAIH